VPQLLLPVPSQQLQVFWPLGTQAKSSSSCCYDGGSQEAWQSVQEADVGQADLQEVLDILLKVGLGLGETEDWPGVVVVSGEDGMGEEQGGEVAGGREADVPVEVSSA